MNWPFMRRKQQNKYTMIFIIAAGIVAMALSLWIGLQQSVWFDEAYSVLVAKHEPSQIIRLASVDVHPPAYYLLLHAWGNMFGWEDYPLRLLSALAFGISVVMAGLLARRLFGEKVALASVIMITLSPLLLRYGFEIRMYSIASLIGVTATYVLVRARFGGKKAVWLWGVYSVLLALGLLTLYHLALLWVAHVTWLTYVDRKKLKQFWHLRWVYAYGAAAVLFLPWLPSFFGQLNNGALASIGQPMNMEQLLGAVSFNLLYKPLWQVGVIETVIMLAVIGAAAWALVRAYKVKSGRQNVLLLSAYITVPVLLFMLVSFLKPVYVERYLSHVAIGLTVLLSVLVVQAAEKLNNQKRLALYVGVGALLFTGVFNLVQVGNFNFQRMQRPAVAQAARTIDCVGAMVVAADPYVATELAYYLPATCDMRFYSESRTMGGGYAPFSESPLRIGETNIPLLTNKLYYAYYDEPKLQVAPNYSLMSKQTNGGLTVVEYEIK